MHTPSTRRQVGRVLLLTLGLNLSVAFGKITIGLMSGALAITADGFHSLIDGTSNVVGLVANHIAAQPPDDEHPYGHRRFETLAALLIGAFLILAAWEIIQGAIGRLRGGLPPELTIMAFVVLGGTLLVNIAVSTYQIREGKRLRSELLLADAANTRADVFVTLSVLVSMVVVTLTGWVWVDVLSALIVVGLIGHAAWRILQHTGRVLVDTAPYTSEELATLLSDLPNVQQIIRARSRGTQDAAHIDIDVQVAPAMTAEQTAAIRHVIQQRLIIELGGVAEVEVHFTPNDSGNDDYALIVRALADRLGVSAHEVIVIDAPDQKIMEMHVEVPPSQSLIQAHHMVTELEAGIQQRLPEIHDVVTHIEPIQTEKICDTPDDVEIAEQINTLLSQQYPLVDWHDLRVFNHQGGMTMITHAALMPDVSVEFAHDLCEQAEILLREHIPHLSRITIHAEPYEYPA